MSAESMAMEDIQLPEKLSALLRLAVKDVQLCEKDPRIILDMDTWHDPLLDEGKCVVCMAGAVMHNTLEADIDKELSPKFFPDNDQALKAINQLRIGILSKAGEFLGIYIKDEQDITFSEIVDYDEDNEYNWHAPWETYLKAAEYLESQGL